MAVLSESFENWPMLIPNQAEHIDPQIQREDFEREATRLFVPDDELNVSIKVCRQGESTKIQCDTLEDVRAHTSKPRKRDTSTIILIHQTFSWGELEISKAAIQDLFSYYNVSSDFWSVVKQFGCRENADHELEGGFNEFTINEHNELFDFSYTVKHVEENGRSEAFDPWSVRQVGLYHNYDAVLNNNLFVVVNPHKALVKMLEQQNAEIDPLEIHRLVLRSVTERWSQYLAHLETLCSEISKTAVLSNAPDQVNTMIYGVRFSDAQRIQNLQNVVLRVSHLLELNIGAIESVTEHLIGRSGISAKQHRNAVSQISTLAIKHKTWQSHTGNLLRRLDGTSSLVRSILDAQALQTLQESSAISAELAGLAREDSIKATKDARRLNIITILGFLYLPASFVATLLGTQYIQIHENYDGKISISFAPEMLIFLLLTVILLVITGGGWYMWERTNRSKEDGIIGSPEKVV